MEGLTKSEFKNCSGNSDVLQLKFLKIMHHYPIAMLTNSFSKFKTGKFLKMSNQRALYNSRYYYDGTTCQATLTNCIDGPNMNIFKREVDCEIACDPPFPMPIFED